ncbi:hypothetical protein AC792_05000 [Arthrobacter sp. RIT-PI-e]|uniref:ArnT family glycosyltransferase n=1 Tax=Arthrobacter sp. RIT-PI-e TaxID=1681197 RepID=UPI0006760811|nr:glycosyltransferase family 39 protein [Arthrobacter sp. RIT-PI-e]KNC19730.1 hypothetical protein AC792_05000 [Arthrobacter sp. RIT-PI-e]
MSHILQRPVGEYRRPAWNEAVAQALPPRFQHESTPRRVAYLPLIGLLAVLTVLSVRLSNTAFVDEALSITIGHNYLDHWFSGQAVVEYGESFSGVPFLYPVLAAVLDTLGGLGLVRGFSLLCVLAAVVFVYRAAVDLGYRSEGMLALAVLALTGPVVFVGALATFDAPVMAMLAGALWAGVRRGWGSAVVSGVLLGLVPMVKYAGVIFLPVVIGIVLLTSTRRRAALAAAITVALPATAWLMWSDRIASGIALNTVDRTVSGDASPGDLVGWMVLDIGILALLALAGMVLLARNGRRQAVLAALLFIGGMAMPAAHLVLGEAVSFDKHMAYSALFLAPSAGYFLAKLSKGVWKFLPVTLLLMVVLLFGFSRSEAMYTSWVDVRPVLDVIEEAPRAGSYISPAAEQLDYHLRDRPEIRNVPLSGYAENPDLVRVAVEDQRFETAILRTVGTGTPDLDAVQDVLLQALRDNPNYELTATLPAREHSETDLWLVFTRVEGQ